MEPLSVSPLQLTFYAPYHRPQRRILTLLNPTHVKVLFKITSNAWSHYHLTPTAGKVEPYNTTEIRISLQCFDFHEDQEYCHKLKILSIFKPDNCFNGETPMAIFRRLSTSEIFTKCLPIKLESKPLLCKSDVWSPPCLKQLVMERDQQLNTLCPSWSEVLTPPSEPQESTNSFIKSLVIILACLLAVYLQLTEMRTNYYPDQVDSSQDSSSSSMDDSYINYVNYMDIADDASPMDSSSNVCISPETYNLNCT